MTKITLFSQEAYIFAVTLLSSNGNDIQQRFFPEENAIETNHPVIASLIKRFASTRTAFFPYLRRKGYWILAGEDRRSVDEVLFTARNFLLPTYAQFEDASPVARFRAFDPTKGEIQEAGKALFAEGGYYRIETFPQDFTHIMGRLRLWHKLEEERPSRHRQENPSYKELLTKFNQALNQDNWESAEGCIRQAEKIDLCTADNLYFWEVQLRAARKEWKEIWDDPNFSSRAQLKMPGPVRAALLTACHISQLTELENQANWEKAINKFKEMRPRLGLLLTGRYGLTQEPVLRMFAYQAIVSEDSDSLEELARISQEAATRHVIESLGRFLPVGKASAPQVSLQTRLRLALDDANYDNVIKIIKLYPDEIDRSLLLLEAAFFGNDLAGELSVKALEAFQGLSEVKRQELIDRIPQVLHYVNAIEMEVNSSKGETTWSARTYLARETTARLICELETLLRRMIEVRYQTKFGNDWIRLINTVSRANWEQAMEKDTKTFSRYQLEPQSILNYSYIGELVSLINNEWSLFEDILGPRKLNKPIFTQKMESVIKVRNPLAHNRLIPENELKVAENLAREIIAIFRKSSPSQQAKVEIQL